MAWVYLLLAGICEMAWPLGYKFSHGFSILRHPLYTLGTVALLLVSFGLMSLAAKTLPVGTVYAVWTGLGATGTAVLGIIYLHEPRNTGRLLCLLLVVIGVVGLKFFSGQMEQREQGAGQQR